MKQPAHMPIIRKFKNSRVFLKKYYYEIYTVVLSHWSLGSWKIESMIFLFGQSSKVRKILVKNSDYYYCLVLGHV